MVRLEMKNYNMILTEKLQKYQHYQLKKLINMIEGEEILAYNQKQIIEQARYTYSSLAKALEKQTGKQVDVLKSQSISNKAYKLKQIDSIFPQDQMNDLIRDRLKRSQNYKIVSN